METGPLAHQLGYDGFIWWVGVVEGMDDPLKVGRTKVRIFGWHDKNVDTLSTDDLPWAYPLVPVTHASSLPNYKHGDWVVGFFLDSRLGQSPVILGVLPAIPQK
jgi:hypothetical protein